MSDPGIGPPGRPAGAPAASLQDILSATTIQQKPIDEMRLRFLKYTTWIFVGLNFFVVVLLCVLAYADMWMFRQVLGRAAPGTPLGDIAQAPRIVTSEVLMALLGATVVQVGSAVIIIAKYLFGKD